MTNSTEDTFDFQAYLQSDELAELRGNRKVESIIRSVSASISIIGSATAIFHILRTHKSFLDIPIHKMMNNTEDTFDFQAYLQSDELAELRHDHKITDIIRTVTGSISINIGLFCD